MQLHHAFRVAALQGVQTHRGTAMQERLMHRGRIGSLAIGARPIGAQAGATPRHPGEPPAARC